MNQQSAHDPIPRTSSRTVIALSRVASIIFHQLFMTTTAALGVFAVVPAGSLPFPSKGLNEWIKTLFLHTVLRPFASILLFKITGLISDAKMHNPKDRVLPLVATVIFYSLAYKVLVLTYQMPRLFQGLLLGSCAAIFIILIINFFYKVSVHTTGVGILPGMCVVLALGHMMTTIFPILLALVVALIVGAIRWFLGSTRSGRSCWDMPLAFLRRSVPMWRSTHKVF